ncbi:MULTISPECIES: DNA/RNA helicase domain-containing protein [unclassified Flavobacterium]|uniref:DNA/RNA helicase domain-containing protein n=1 Tax=unclassified Flavobacterium TaxID=196869 RepID=UPI001E49CA33|nr:MULTISPECIES: DNA/RNA helicase domain-containing protein [unclassified Flavobacterium]
MNRAYYSNFINDFIVENNDSIYGKISGNYDLNKLTIQQSNAWKTQIEILKQTILNFKGRVYFEFTIPIMGKRVDNILIIDNCIFVLEFKIDSNSYDKYAKDQAFDYGLDLNNFHEGSHAKNIIPILIADKASNVNNVYKKSLDNLYETIVANENNLSEVISESLAKFKDLEIVNVDTWENSIYKPTPTIIEAATALYKKHNVSEISRSDSGAENLSVTSECISEIIDYSKNESRKSICFITGVPGAGKTLAGLNIANLRSNYEQEEHAVFLSGNGPLVDVLREALARDKVKSSREENSIITKSFAKSHVKSFIQKYSSF